MARILVVDDNADIRLALKAILESVGHEVFELADGSEAPGSVVEIDPDLVLLDVAMPRVDGFETLRNLKADERTSGIPVLMVTAKGRPEDLARAKSLGAHDFIGKPWGDGEVELRVGWIIDAAGRAPG